MARTSEDIADLLERVSQGDRVAFSALYQATHLKLFGICVRILRRRELAEEILQEVYLKVWNGAGAFQRGRASPITWLSIIARNRALDEVRKRCIAVAEDTEAAEAVSDDAKTPSEQMELSDELQQLEDCLGRLEREKRDAVMLAYLDGYSRADLAQKYGQPIGTVKSWLHRSLKQLKDCLES